jgi:GntR family transcriptional regulator
MNSPSQTTRTPNTHKRVSTRLCKAIPVYKTIQNAIRKRIEAKEVMPGDAVPSERELAKTHKVSLMTARHVLAGLEQEGLVERRQGAGTFVALPKIHFNNLMSYSELLASRGLVSRSRVLVAKVIEHEQEAAARLGLSTSSPLVKIERLRLAAEEPFALETCYLPAADFSGCVRAALGSALGRISLFATLEHDYGVELTYADEEVDASTADSHIAQWLGVPESAPVLRIRQVIYSTKGKATLYGVGLAPMRSVASGTPTCGTRPCAQMGFGNTGWVLRG